LEWRANHLKRDAMLIRVKTDTGLTGYAPGPAHERAQKKSTTSSARFSLARTRGNGPIQISGDLEITKPIAPWKSH